jgi:hypothetical protein
MNKIISSTLLFGMLSLSSFMTSPVNHEQIAFDYFLSDILTTDFKDLSTLEFKGKTEDTFSTLGTYKFCLKSQERFHSMMEGVTKQSVTVSKQIKYSQIKNLAITNFNKNSTGTKLYIYPSVHAADNFYVFISVGQSGAAMANYVFELTPEGKILRSCKMG